MGRAWGTWVGYLVTVLVIVPALIGRGCQSPVTGGLVGAGDLTVAVYFPDRRAVLRLPLEEYVIGVTAGEMPPSFADEALKAQMVAARTYTVRHMRKFGGAGCSLHPDADVCADPDTSQAYLDPVALRQRHGAITAIQYQRRLAQAQAATAGEIITYRGAPIEAVYHSSSGTTTEDAQAVWSAGFPYLRPVDDAPGQTAPRYVDRVSITPAELARRLGIPTLSLDGDRTDDLVAVVQRSPGGRVQQAVVGDRTFAGTALRERLGLRSTNFEATEAAGRVVFTTRGYGHGLGMSQYGANGMAAGGADYREILAHYYPGTRIEPIFNTGPSGG